MLEVLNKNRSLIWLNLSHNTLISVKDQQEMGEISLVLLNKNSKFAPIREFIKEKAMEVSVLRRLKNKQNRETYPEKVTRCFGNLVRHNRQIQFLGLENIGLSHKIITQLLEQMTKAKSLLSLNISDNPGIVKSISRNLRGRLKVKKNKKEKVLEL
jgi:Leucine-rich repeat (LRR) protein